MLPQGGTDTRIWREVTGLGAEVADLADLRGSRVEPDIALIWDWEAWWALELEWRPSRDLDYLERVRAWYEAAWRAGLTVDFVHPEHSLGRYPLVVAPSLYLTTPAAAANLTRYVADGGVLLVSYFSGIVDAHDSVHPGAYPGALREVLGVTVEEWRPLLEGERVRLAWEEGGEATADSWTEAVRLAGAKPVLRYADGPAAGGPAVTRHELGAGQAWYVSARTDPAATARLLAAVSGAAGLATRNQPDLEIVRRSDGTRRFITLINHGAADTDTEVGGRLVNVPAGEVVVIREEAAGVPGG
jgi:beta-galactosidase